MIVCITIVFLSIISLHFVLIYLGVFTPCIVITFIGIIILHLVVFFLLIVIVASNWEFDASSSYVRIDIGIILFIYCLFKMKNPSEKPDNIANIDFITSNDSHLVLIQLARLSNKPSKIFL